MLTTASRLRVQEILKRLAMGDEVTLEERIYINKFAARDQNVSSWLRKASYYQRKNVSSNSIDQLLNGLDICESDPHSTFNPDQDDLGEWFSGAPSWIRRS
tara:strand:- start:228 stop:530 length:303 start_codon:yes stop_codon:yes gene_type:complete